MRDCICCKVPDHNKCAFQNCVRPGISPLSIELGGWLDKYVFLEKQKVDTWLCRVHYKQFHSYY